MTLMNSLKANNNNKTMAAYPFQNRSKIATKSVLTGCILYIALSTIINTDGVVNIDYDHGRRMLKTTSISREVVQLHRKLAETLSSTAQQQSKQREEEHRASQKWYQVHGSTRLQWNMSPRQWPTCPTGQDVFVTDTAFTFHGEFPDPTDPTQITKSKSIRFRLQQKDDRSCLWNYSKACLAGGNFVMTFGKTAGDLHNPGDFTLKTTDGPIRIVAYNSNRACSRTNPGKQMIMSMKDGSATVTGDVKSSKKTLEPLDYLRQASEYTEDPTKCREWIEEREKRQDLFKLNTDLATVHIDTPWMQLIIQVHQNKVVTSTLCNYAEMHVWMTNVKPGFFSLDNNKNDGEKVKEERKLKGDEVQKKGGDIHMVDGPWGT